MIVGSDNKLCVLIFYLLKEILIFVVLFIIVGMVMLFY